MNKIHAGAHLNTRFQVVNFNRHEDKHILNLYLGILPNNASSFGVGYSVTIHYVCCVVFSCTCIVSSVHGVHTVYNVMASNYTSTSPCYMHSTLASTIQMDGRK